MVLTALGFLRTDLTAIGRNRSARGISPLVQTEQQGELNRPSLLPSVRIQFSLSVQYVFKAASLHILRFPE